ncbi:FMRFamide neuropeptide, partial [Bacillus toyonensis]
MGISKGTTEEGLNKEIMKISKGTTEEGLNKKIEDISKGMKRRIHKKWK